MKICRVVGHVWSTKKDESLNGFKFMIVEEMIDSKRKFVAVDIVGAGMGELVLVVSGSSARVAAGADRTPIDSIIVGIVDSLEIGNGCEENDDGR